MATDSPRFSFLKADLKLAIDQFRIEPGSFVVVRPKNKDTRFTQDYCDWLSENLQEVLPPGTKAIIQMEDSTKIQVLDPEVGEDCPPGEAEAYRAGWYNAFEALEQACS